MVEHELPILVIEADELDFMTNEADYQTIIQQISKPYPVGLHYWKAEEQKTT
jgi:deoxyadenosine/deoxycytidine kinase